MTEGRWYSRLRARSIYLSLVALCMFAALLPLNAGPAGWPRPDMVLAITLAWAIRQPEDLPVLLLAPVFLGADLLLMRPPGLHAALVVIVVEVLRNRQRRMRSLPFLAEWITMGLIVAATATTVWAVQALLLIEQPPWHPQMMRAGATLIAYPAAVAVLHYAFSVRKRAAPEGFGGGAKA